MGLAVSAASSLVLVLAGLPMLAIWGLQGILITMLASYVLQALVLWLVGGNIIRAACQPENSLASSGSSCTLESADEIYDNTAESDLAANPGYAG